MDIGSQRRPGGTDNASGRTLVAVEHERLCGGASSSRAHPGRRRSSSSRRSPSSPASSSPTEPDAPAAQRFVDAWEAGDLEAMYAELTPEAQEEYSLERFQRALRGRRGDARRSPRSAPARSREDGDDAVVAGRPSAPTSSATSAASSTLPIADDQVAWAPNLVYPGLTAGERLSRRTRAPAAGRDPGRRPHAALRGAGRGARGRRRGARRRRRGRGAEPSPGARAGAARASRPAR